MTQEERWNAQYERMMDFMKTNHRRPSKHRIEEHDMLNWFKATKKMVAKGDYPPERLKKFELVVGGTGTWVFCSPAASKLDINEYC